MYQMEDDLMTEEECREHQLRFEITKVEMRNTREQIEIWEYDRKILDAEHRFAMRKLENQRMKTDRCCSCKDIFLKFCQLIDSPAVKEKWKKINEIITKYNNDVKTEIEKQTETRIQRIKVKYAALREKFESLKIVKTLRAAEKELNNLNEKHAQLQAEFTSLKEEEFKNKIAFDEIYQNFIIKSVEFNKYIMDSTQEINELQTNHSDTQLQITNLKELNSKLINEIAIVQREYDIKQAECEKINSMTPKFIKKIFLPEDFFTPKKHKYSIENKDESNKKRKIFEGILITPRHTADFHHNEKVCKTVQFNENVEVKNMSSEYSESDQSISFVAKNTNQNQFFATSSLHNTTNNILISSIPTNNGSLKIQKQTKSGKLSVISTNMIHEEEILEKQKKNENISFLNIEQLPEKIENPIILSQESFRKLCVSEKVDQKHYENKSDHKMLKQLNLDSVTDSTSCSKSNTEKNYVDLKNGNQPKTDTILSKREISENNFNKMLQSQGEDPSIHISDTFIEFNPDDDLKNFMVDEPLQNNQWNENDDPENMDDSNGFIEQNNTDSFDFFDKPNYDDGCFF